MPHPSSGGTILNVSHLIRTFKGENGKGAAALTPFASYCFGAALARWLLLDGGPGETPDGRTVCVGRDPRPHGERLSDSFARGVESVPGARALYTGLASTPCMDTLVRLGRCDAAAMVTASHLPEEKNGIKMFSDRGSPDVDELMELARAEAREWYTVGLVPPSSGREGVLCSGLVDYLPEYAETLARALRREVGGADPAKPLEGLRIVVNPGKGSGCFFSDLLSDLGADTRGSIHCTPDGTFPESFGVPNPEKASMVDETIEACHAHDADLGVMFDTDADRAGFVLPNGEGAYEPLNRNRLIAMLGYAFSSQSPGCTVVTDSTTSEGLSDFLSGLGLNHVRYLRGYANVIRRAKEITANDETDQVAEVAIETSGHCAMRENGYVDDGTYTAVKIIGLLARSKAAGTGSLLENIAGLGEMEYDREFRLNIADGFLETTSSIFQLIVEAVLTEQCESNDDWTVDTDNLEGVRVRLCSGGFFMLRQSLHDPVISLQIESVSEDVARENVLRPLVRMFKKYDLLEYGSLEKE